MSFVRISTKGGRQYRQLVESYWDPKAKRSRTRILRHLGPVAPRFPRADPTLLPPALPMEPVHFGLLATRMMTGTLTAAHVVQTVQEMGEEMPPGVLQAVGIRFDLAEKKLGLLLWLEPPSSRSGPVPSAKRPSNPSGPTPQRSSPSKGRVGRPSRPSGAPRGTPRGFSS